MRVELPEPTPSEARCLILGTGAYWLCCGVMGVAFASWVVVVVVVVAAAFVAFGFLWIGGVGHVCRRAVKVADPRLRLGALDYFFMPGPDTWLPLRVAGPAYFGRAARVLGWSRLGVALTLGAILMADLILAASMSPASRNW